MKIERQSAAWVSNHIAPSFVTLILMFESRDVSLAAEVRLQTLENDDWRPLAGWMGVLAGKAASLFPLCLSVCPTGKPSLQ